MRPGLWSAGSEAFIVDEVIGSDPLPAHGVAAAAQCSEENSGSRSDSVLSRAGAVATQGC